MEIPGSSVDAFLKKPVLCFIKSVYLQVDGDWADGLLTSGQNKFHHSSAFMPTAKGLAGNII